MSHLSLLVFFVSSVRGYSSFAWMVMSMVTCFMLLFIRNVIKSMELFAVSVSVAWMVSLGFSVWLL